MQKLLEVKVNFEATKRSERRNPAGSNSFPQSHAGIVVSLVAYGGPDASKVAETKPKPFLGCGPAELDVLETH